MEQDKSQIQWAQFSALPAPQIVVNRFDDSRLNRFYYYSVPEDGKLVVKTAAGITSVLGAVMPTSSFLTDWKLNTPDYEKVLKASSEYGTLLHLIYSEYLIKKEINKDYVEAARQIAIEFGDGYDLIDKDILSFFKFCEDYQPEILLSEAMLLSQPINGDQLCMTIDLLCAIWVDETRIEQVEDGVYQRGDRKGQPKIIEKKVTEKVRKIALVDFKSNLQAKQQKTFFQSHLFQLLAGRRAVEYNYPDIHVDIIANLSPTGWRTNPSYAFKIWEPSTTDETLLDAYLEVARIQGLFRPSGYKFVPPEYTLETKSSDFRVMSYLDYASEILLGGQVSEGDEVV